jgi:hypothetical protein
LIALAFVGGIALSVFASSVLAGKPQPSAVKLEFVDYVPFAGCPGDQVDYVTRWTVAHPAILFVTSSHIRGLDAEGDTAIPGRAASAALVPIPTARILEDDDGAFVIPDLPPGGYARVLAVGTLSEDSDPSMVLFPYTILDDCLH